MAALPLLAAAVFHLVRGDLGWWGWGVVAAVGATAAFTDVVARRRRARRHAEGAVAGREVWRGAVPTGDFGGFQPGVSRILLLRDLVPADIELLDSALAVIPARRFQRLGIRPIALPWPAVRLVQSEELGHLRPDGTLSTGRSRAVVVTTAEHGRLHLIVDDADALTLLSRIGWHRARSNSPGTRSE